MIRSMTGFGAAEGEVGGSRVSVEIRAVNHRFFNPSVKLPSELARWEGDEMPPPPAEVARSGGGDAALDKSLSTAPKTGEKNWLRQLMEKLGW